MSLARIPTAASPSRPWRFPVPILPVNSLFREISRAHAAWVPHTSWVTSLSDAQRHSLLGVRPDDSDRTLLRVIQAQRRGMGSGAPSIPPTSDWRTRGRGLVGPARNQGRVATGLAFATIALVESMAAIESGELLELSAADVGAASWPTTALEELKRRGVTTEAVFPACMASATSDPSVHGSAERAVQAVRVGEHSLLFTAEERKRWLAEVGPVLAVFRVHDDFFSYRSGVYRHVMGAIAGYHAVVVVGYDDAEACWICKNSWGESWGEQGFVNIGYGECGIDDRSPDTDDADLPLQFPFWGVHRALLPTPPPPRLRSVHASHDSDGGVDVFAIDCDGAVVHARPPRVDGGPWRYADLGGQFVQVVTAKDIDGRRELLAIDADGGLWHNLQIRPRPSPWRGWRRIADETRRVAVAGSIDGRIQVFAIGRDGRLRHIWKLRPFESSWSAWLDLGGALRDVIALPDAHGRLTVLGIGSSGGLWTMTQVDSVPTRWGPWCDLDGTATQISAIMNAEGGFEVFAVAADGALHQISQARAGGPWGAWKDLGGSFTEVHAVRAGFRNIAVVASSPEGLQTMHQCQPDGEWSEWRPLAGPVKQVDATFDTDGRITVIAIGAHDRLWAVVNSHSLTTP